MSPRYYLRIVMNDIRARFGSVPGGTRVIFVAGYPKSGTTWVENFVSHIPGYSPRNLSGSAEVLRMHGLPPDAFDEVPGYAYSAIKTHISPSAENVDVLVGNGIRKVLVMYRDPRDIVVSHYYHVLKSNPWKPDDPWYADYTRLSKEEGISHSMDMIIDDYCAWVGGWREIAESNPDIDCLFITYEDLRNNPKQVFEDILSFFGIELSQEQLTATMAASEGRSASSKLVFGQPGKRSTKRKGAFGEWKKEMTEEQKHRFREKAGRLLVSLGYERDLDW